MESQVLVLLGSLRGCRGGVLPRSGSGDRGASTAALLRVAHHSTLPPAPTVRFFFRFIICKWVTVTLLECSRDWLWGRCCAPPARRLCAGRGASRRAEPA